MTHRRVKQIENLALVGVCNMHVGILNLEHVKVIWGHSVHFSENWAVTQKRLIVERNGWKFGPRGCIKYACWYFWPWTWTCQGHWGLFGGLFPKLARNSKTAYRRVKQTKIWASLVYVTCMLVFLTWNMARSFGVIRYTFRKLACNSKTAHRRVKRMKIWAQVGGRGGVERKAKGGARRWGEGGVCYVHVGSFDLEHVKSHGVIQCTFPKIGPQLKNCSS